MTCTGGAEKFTSNFITPAALHVEIYTLLFLSIFIPSQLEYVVVATVVTEESVKFIAFTGALLPQLQNNTLFLGASTQIPLGVETVAFIYIQKVWVTVFNL